MQAFPSYRYDGDKDAAAALRLVAQNLLHQARLIDGVSASRITKLNRQTPQGTVEVLIVEGQEYVFITGVDARGRNRRRVEPVLFKALSGVIQFDFALPDERLVVAYKPTVDAFTNVLGSPDRFSPSEFREAGDLLNQGGDSPEIRSQGCAFSGLLAVMLDLLAGFRNLDLPEGVSAKPEGGLFSASGFVSSNESTHGIVKFGNTPWLVEISMERGVLAMKLPMASVKVISPDEFENDAELVIQKSDATDECQRLFGGIPSGESFPTRPADLVRAVAAGDVRVLIPPTGLFDYYGRTDNVVNFAWLGNGTAAGPIGWSFNSSGTEAHNTNGQRVFGAPPRLFAQHWKISFGGGEDSISAALSLVERSLFIERTGTQIGIFNTQADGFGGVTGIRGDRPAVLTEGGVDIDESSSVTVFVGHHGDAIFKCRYESSIRAVDEPAGNGLVSEANPLVILESGISSRVFIEGISTGASTSGSFERGEYRIPIDAPVNGGPFVDVQNTGRCAAFWWSPQSRDAVCILSAVDWSVKSVTVRYENAETIIESLGGGASASNQVFEVLCPRGRFIRVQPPDPSFFEPSGDNVLGRRPLYSPRLPPNFPVGPFELNNRRVFVQYSTAGPNPHLICSGSPVFLGVSQGLFVLLSAEAKSAFGLNFTGLLIGQNPPSAQTPFAFLGFI